MIGPAPPSEHFLHSPSLAFQSLNVTPAEKERYYTVESVLRRSLCPASWFRSFPVDEIKAVCDTWYSQGIDGCHSIASIRM